MMLLQSPKVIRFIDVLGATLIGALVTGGALYLVARGARMQGGGVWYTLVYIVATGLGYRGVQRITAAHPALRAVIGILGLAPLVWSALNWRALGFEDPGVAVIVPALFIGIAYWITGARKPETTT